jgi:hypothetical protein
VCVCVRVWEWGGGIFLLLRNRSITNATLTKMLARRVVRKPPKLVLDRLGQMRGLHDRILSLLVREIGVKVRHVENGFLFPFGLK